MTVLHAETFTEPLNRGPFLLYDALYMKYDPASIEQKWQKEWEKKKLYKTIEDASKQKFYVLDMFPYPSGEGLHVGHPKGYIATDVVSRMKRMQGFNVLHPMGFDAFGLPAENYAIKMKTNPAIAVAENVARYKKQLEILGFDYDWSREINTTDPKYYKWTQWIFLKLLEKGLAHEAYEPINWCPVDKTGLANEDIEDGKCERCGAVVEKRMMKQWVLKITDYADRLLADLDAKDADGKLLLDWPESIKESQRNWIGRSEGVEIDFAIKTNSPIEIMFATNNKAKIARARKMFEHAGVSVILKTPENLGIAVIDTDENGSLEENAREKALVYKGKTNLPILALDTGLFIEGEKIDPVKVKRNALNGVDEKTLSQEEVFEEMFNFYKGIAQKRGGEVDGAWQDAFCIIYPDGTEKITTAERLITLTDQPHGEKNIYFPVLQLYKNKVNNKWALEQTEEEEKEAFAPVIKAMAELVDSNKIKVFTTRPDTLFGVTYVVLAPEHSLVQELLNSISNKSEVEAYIASAKLKSEIDRTDATKEKTGVELKGVTAINPANNEEVSVWVADYVLADYGTGAVMAVPAHDERDFAFAKNFGLPIRQVIMPSLIDTSNPPQEGKENTFRNLILAIVHDPKTNKYLTLKWKKEGWTSFVTGGVEENEDRIEAAKREITEETGYANVKLVRSLGMTEAFFFAKHKNVNRTSNAEHFLFELIDDSKTEVAQEEQDQHEVEWLSFAELSATHLQHAEGEILLHKIQTGNDTYTGSGKLINSGEFNSLSSIEAKNGIAEKFGKKVVRYKLRDWVFSRQRYWGEPIPVLHDKNGKIIPVSEKDLPVTLPKVDHYEPTDTGESPLANISEWVNVSKGFIKKENFTRETNTMPQWAGSSWYYLRYMDVNNDRALVDPAKEKYWNEVDLYVGGAEHATRHLIYARFWHKFLYDIGVVSTIEPFKKLQSVGLIMASDGRKMSKRWGNVINPDDIVKNFGADPLRLYEMFMGPFDQAIAWNTDGLVGTRRFIERVWKLKEKVKESVSSPKKEIETLIHQTIKKITEDIASLKFNTAVSQLMIALNSIEKESEIAQKDYETILQLLAPFAPHVTEELWNELGHKDSIHSAPWPVHDATKLVGDSVSIAVQVNGKTREVISVARDSGEEEAKTTALATEGIQKWVAGKTIKKVIWVKNKILNLLVD